MSAQSSPGVTATLVDNAANQPVDVNITAAPPPVRVRLTLTAGAGALGLSWPPGDLGMILQTNAVSVASPADWLQYPGSTSVTNVSTPIDPSQTNVFFRLLYP